MNYLEQARAYITTAPLAVSGHNGHGTTFKVACTLLHGFALSVEDALKLMNEYNERLDEPWTKPELKHKVEDADKTTSRLPNGYKLVQRGPYKRTPPAAPAQRATWKIIPKAPPATPRPPAEPTRQESAVAPEKEDVVLEAPARCTPGPEGSLTSAQEGQKTAHAPCANINPIRSS